MTRMKQYAENESTQLRGVVYFIVPAKKKGFPSDSRALETISDIDKQRRIDVVASDQGQTYSLVYRYCVDNKIDFLSKGQDLKQNPNCLDKILELYQQRTTKEQQTAHPNIAYLTRFNDCKTLSAIAENLAARGIRTEIRKVF